MSRRTSLLLALFALAAPATAQLTEKEAVKQVENVSKAQIKSFKQNCAAALGTLDANLATFEAQFDENSTAADLGQLVGGMAFEYMTALNDAWSDAKDLVEFATTVALDDLGNGEDLDGLYPLDLYYGGGGVLDKNRAALVKAGMKSRDAAVKRLKKTAAKAEKVAHITLTFVLVFPTRPNAVAIDQDGNGEVAHTATLDVVVTASDLDAQNDGVLVAGGQAGFESDVTVGYLTQGITESTDVAPQPGTLRFGALFEGLPEGGYVVFERQGDDGAQDTVVEIGLR